MKHLILVRHSKSSWDYQVNDKDRPLLERGITDGHLIANLLHDQKMTINAAYSSPANRALHTCMIFLRTLHFPMENFEVKNELYDFSGEYVMQQARELNNTLDTVLFFGHNYAFTSIANTWGDKAIDNVPTSGLVQLSFNVDQWDAIGYGVTEQILFPKQFK